MMKLPEVPDRVQRHLTLAQGAIAVLTGLVTIIGAGYSVYRFLNPVPDNARLEVVIQESEAGAPLPGATVEILSTSKVLIATLAADQDGRVRYTLKDGRYDVRVRQNGYADTTREIQVTPGQDVSLTVRLTTATIKGLQNSFKKVIGRGSSSKWP